MLSLKQLTHRFGSLVAVDDVSFSLEKGDIAAFLGPNGAGKSTTIKIITGFLRPDSGSITLAGRDVLKEPIAAQRELGYLPENGPLYPEMTVAELLRFAAGCRGLARSDARGAMARAVEACALEPVYHQTIGTLSKGYRQRTALAQAIMHEPPCLILDEPTEGLDPNQKQQVRETIRAMAHDKAILIATHNLAEAQALCNRFIIIADGQKRADETPAAFQRRHPLHGALRLLPEPQQGRTLKAVLATHGAVGEIRTEDGSEALTVIPRDGQALAPVLSDLARAGKVRYASLETVPVDIEAVFRDLTRRQPSASTPPA